MQQRDDADRHARGDEEADADVEAAHRFLQQTRAARVDLELRVQMLAAFLRPFIRSFAERLQLLGALAHAIDAADRARGRRDQKRARREDQHRRA
jgi:hypothetical protein